MKIFLLPIENHLTRGCEITRGEDVKFSAIVLNLPTVVQIIEPEAVAVGTTGAGPAAVGHVVDSVPGQESRMVKHNLQRVQAAAALHFRFISTAPPKSERRNALFFYPLATQILTI